MASTVTSASSSRPLIRGKLRLPEPRQQDPSASYTVATKLKDEVVLERPGARKPSSPIPYSEFSSTSVAQPFVNPTGVFEHLGQKPGAS
ncbi:hypothetical protein CONLIGDRAFT_635826 [Coniochaeta ligniaria NRRL 30616]|uniref:Uncharacterized protein n=1 Tax=Coniochaeta ligniaria NRRL 30616 TaxID=1408157 RepID=A0A1J7JA39_9PEZI|nr:hypothetical protein CONLIGDRAFT_635826 [Coniochaeta ligniaria NRRL 30616]